MTTGDFTGPIVEIIPIETKVINQMNRYVYCHHCQRMDERHPMRVLGRAPEGGPVYQCRHCYRNIHIK